MFTSIKNAQIEFVKNVTVYSKNVYKHAFVKNVHHAFEIFPKCIIKLFHVCSKYVHCILRKKRACVETK